MLAIRSFSRALPHQFKRVGTFRAMSSNFRYLDSHEYVRIDGKTGTIGITDFAQAQLGDVVYVDLPAVGEEFEKGESFGSVESVKAASDVYVPMSGTVIEINEKLISQPELVNSHAMTDAWFIKLELANPSDTDGLLDDAAYAELCKEASE